LDEIKLSLDEFCTGNEQSDDITMLLIEFLSG
jgi:serine phosphatase RsbU (regulator of sigma subunit)